MRSLGWPVWLFHRGDQRPHHWRRTACPEGLPALVARLSEVGFDDLALTTNGMELAGVASELAAAGLRRVNVSCDSLRAERFGADSPPGEPGKVLDAMDAAEEAGLVPLKVNVVLLRGQNDDEILAFARFRPTYGTGGQVHRIHATRRRRSVEEGSPGPRPRGLRSDRGGLAPRAGGTGRQCASGALQIPRWMRRGWTDLQRDPALLRNL